jgi:hypothetical protein
VKQADLVESVWRLGRRPDPWSWPDWSFAGADGTFGNRFDDPLGVYRVLYGSAQRLATFVECLAVFRPDPEVLAECDRIEGDTQDGGEPPGAGVVPVEWVEQRCVGTGHPEGAFVELGQHETLADLRSALAARVVHHKIGDLDAAAIRLSVPRAFTQEISRYLFEQTVAGRRHWNGIVYQSKYGDDLKNCAFFEPSAPTGQTSTLLDVDDPDLHVALRVHSLRLG